MTVSIDPSQVRRQATVEAQPSGEASGQPSTLGARLPVRVLLLGGLGGAGLLAFTIGAFSFFGGLADPRVRPIRPAPVASKMPDLKDGVPALVSDGGEAAPTATVLNLPKPRAAEPVATPAETAPRLDAPAEAAVSLAPAAARAAADATGSVAQPASAAIRAKATPGIENARTVSGDAKPVALIAPARTAGPLAPARAETVRAKPAAVAALAPEHEPPPAAAPKQAARDAAPEAKAVEKPADKAAEKTAEKPTRKPAQKVARSKAKPVAEASAEPDAVPAPAAASAAEPDDDGITSKVKGGLKAIGGLFGQD